MPIPDWQQLKSLGANRIVRSSYVWFAVVPLAAKTVQLPTVSEWIGTVHLPFSWQCFFFAALAFAAGTFLHDLRSPWCIREFRTPKEFMASGFNEPRLLGEFDCISRDLPRAGFAEQDAASFQTMLEAAARDVLPDRVRARNDAFQALCAFARHIRPRSRLAVTLCYAVGFTLLLIVAVQNVISVCRAA